MISSDHLTMRITSLFICLIVAFSFGCDRPTKDTTKLSVSLPSGGVGQLSCSHCLKMVIINISGDGFPTIAETFEDPLGMDSQGTELSGTVEISEVPVGVNRTIQVLALYRESNNSLTVHFANTLVEVDSDGPNEFPLTVASLGVFKGGSIVGRYLTGTDTGPTGRVKTSFSAVGHPELKVIFEQTDILNGWFNFFASENFLMTYTMDDGTQIFKDVTLDSLAPLTGGTPVKNIARVHRPGGIYRFNGSIWEPENESHDIIYGFFGNAALTTGKNICLEYNHSTSLAFLKLSSNVMGTMLLTYDESSVTADVYGIGGTNVSVDSAACVGQLTADRLSLNRINVSKNQLDGNGNDTANGANGAFTYVNDGGAYNRLYQSGSLYTLHALPGIYSATPGAALFDGVKLYKKYSSANKKSDFIECSESWLVNQEGYSLFNNFSANPSIVADVITFSLAAVSGADIHDAFILCPTKAGSMQLIGGSNLRNLTFANISAAGASSFTGPSENTLNFTNNGGGGTNITPVSTNWAGVIDYKGGAYPGIGGTCNTYLAAGQTCSVVLRSVGGSTSGNFKFYYDSNANGGSTMVMVTLTATP